MFDEKGRIVLISLYVDDLMITGNADKFFEEIKVQMSQMFEIEDLDELCYCFDLEISRDLGQNFLAQSKYTRSLLNFFKMDQCKAPVVSLQ